MSEAEHLPPMTPDEFFVWQAEQDRNYELVDGIPVLTPKAMTGATRRHDRITVNVLATFARRLSGKPCQPFTDDIATRNPNSNVRRPDVTVDCGTGDDRSMETADPRVVIEVLSPSTMSVDRITKVEEYKKHPSVHVILLVDTRMPSVAVWRRVASADWTYTVFDGLDAAISLPEIGTEIALAEIYESLSFEVR